MSRSNLEERPINPAKRFFEWEGKKGHFSYYDRELKAKVDVPLPFTFIVLDQLATIGGFSDPLQSGFWSNEIKKADLKTGVLKVRTKNGLIQEGVYDAIKGKEAGMKFCESVYIVYIENKELIIGNIKMVGAALNAWIDFTSGVKADKSKGIESSPAHNPMVGAITVTGFVDKKKGSNEYMNPVFATKEIKPETEAKVIELDKQLQEYLKEYFAYNSSAVAESDKTETTGTSDNKVAESAIKANDDFLPETSLPDQSAKAVLAAKQAAVTPVVDIYNDLPEDF